MITVSTYNNFNLCRAPYNEIIIIELGCVLTRLGYTSAVWDILTAVVLFGFLRAF